MKLNEHIVCADGFSMSVQANGGAYCEPKVFDAEKYEAVEVGYPNAYEGLLAYYVPAQVIVDVIAKHGGIITGELPNGIPYLKAI